MGIVLLIAAAHVVGIGRHLQPEWAALYSSYFSDLVLPFGFYFLLFLPDTRWPLLARWEVKAAAVFLMAAAAETLQYLGVDALGTVFDPLDYVMYAAGVTLAACVDTQLLRRTVAFWREGTLGRST